MPKKVKALFQVYVSDDFGKTNEETIADIKENISVKRFYSATI